jgi:hypothetical protein
VEHRIGGCNDLSRRRRGGNSARHVNELQSAIGDDGRAPHGPRAPRLPCQPPARISAGMMMLAPLAPGPGAALASVRLGQRFSFEHFSFLLCNISASLGRGCGHITLTTD